MLRALGLVFLQVLLALEGRRKCPLSLMFALKIIWLSMIYVTPVTKVSLRLQRKPIGSASSDASAIHKHGAQYCLARPDCLCAL